jgi:hypothetical protein
MLVLARLFDERFGVWQVCRYLPGFLDDNYERLTPLTRAGTASIAKVFPFQVTANAVPTATHRDPDAREALAGRGDDSFFQPSALDCWITPTQESAPELHTSAWKSRRTAPRKVPNPRGTGDGTVFANEDDGVPAAPPFEVNHRPEATPTVSTATPMSNQRLCWRRRASLIRASAAGGLMAACRGSSRTIMTPPTKPAG